jgi:ribosome-associated translation inhibitor RaiA
MKTEPHIVWKNIEASPALDERIRKELEELDKAYDRITSCRVVVEKPHKHQRHGAHFQVKIEVSVPGKTLNVTRDPDEHENAQDPYASVNEAFWTMRRQIEDYIRVRRGL